jgi:sortase (surface protein transpeptidase)
MTKRGVQMTDRHDRIVKVFVEAIRNKLELSRDEIWENVSMIKMEEEDNRKEGHFKHIGWSSEVANLKPDVTFWKKTSDRLGKVKIL